ncbi:MAG: DegT/DnrJ/EryC1/StrS family aminotransferase [Bacteroidetes bacterium]|jgi:dTDP-4-amino-4,6-dideoxygalactose transaminase|nr:DegT/DnrJ/EryC1/StrS family aminotransferase [Bacteroidota bacterium]
MKIPFVDLYAQYQTIKGDIDFAIESVIAQSAYIGGNYVSKFEKDYEAWLPAKHIISCANGTDSLEIILKAWNIGKGDEVIVPAMTWISTAEAVSNVGATPVFADVDSAYYTILPEEITAKITKNTKAIIPVHLYGQCANMPEIMKIARVNNLKVLEDCAQAHGAEIDGVRAGLWGDAASFSFYPGKNLGSYGDAGCITTNDDELFEMCKIITNHGQKGKHNHLIVGRNSRMDGMQAAILSAKLPNLDQWNNSRNEKGIYYNSNIDPEKYGLPQLRENSKHVFHIYSLVCKNRNYVVNELNNAGISTAVHYPTELPATKVYQSSEVFPNSKHMANHNLSIPIYPEMTIEQLDYVIDILNKI